MEKVKVAFICVHNSCRSQIAEALTKEFASDTIEAFSAGTIIKDHINQDAVRLMKEIYNIDMEKSQYPKLISDIGEFDIGITMGCDVVCPAFLAKYRQDWGLDDPTGKSDVEFIKVIDEIYTNIVDLKEKILNKEIVFEKGNNYETR